MRKLIYAGILLVCLLIQSTLLVQYRPLGVIPELLLLVVVGTSLVKGPKLGVQVGLAAGILQDLLIGNFGTNIVINVFIAFLVGNMEGKIYKQRVLIPIFIVFVATFLHQILFLLLSEQLIFSIPPLWALKAKIFPLAIVNSILMLLVYPGLYFIEKKLYYY